MQVFSASAFGKLEVPTQTSKRARKMVNCYKNAKLTARGPEEIAYISKVGPRSWDTAMQP